VKSDYRLYNDQWRMCMEIKIVQFTTPTTPKFQVFNFKWTQLL